MALCNVTVDVKHLATRLRSQLMCTRLHDDYVDAIKGLCEVSV